MKHSLRMRVLRRTILLSALSLCGIGYGASPVIHGQKDTPARWFPTRVPEGTTFVGDQACVECHRSKAASQSQSSMRAAMESVAESRILTTHPRLTFRNPRWEPPSGS